jgi:hypothetical protein
MRRTKVEQGYTREARSGIRSRWLGRAGVLGCGIAIASILPNGCVPKIYETKNKVTQTQPAEAISVTPESIDLRARIGARVMVDALTYKEVWGKEVPGSYNLALFRGYNKEGRPDRNIGGTVNIYVGADTNGVWDERYQITDPNTKATSIGHHIHIPRDMIKFLTASETGSAVVIPDSGLITDVSLAISHTVPSAGANARDIFHESQATLGATSAAMAENIVQQACAPKLWPKIKDMFKLAYQKIGLAQYNKQVQLNPTQNIEKFDPNTLDVVFDPVAGLTEPDFSGPWAFIDSGVDFKFFDEYGHESKTPVCVDRTVDYPGQGYFAPGQVPVGN